MSPLKPEQVIPQELRKIVEVRMVETNLAPGLYLVGTLVLNGANSSPWPNSAANAMTS